MKVEPYVPDLEHRERLEAALAAVRAKGNKTLEASILAALGGQPLNAGECFAVKQHPENLQI